MFGTRDAGYRRKVSRKALARKRLAYERAPAQIVIASRLTEVDLNYSLKAEVSPSCIIKTQLLLEQITVVRLLIVCVFRNLPVSSGAGTNELHLTNRFRQTSSGLFMILVKAVGHSKQW